MMLAEDTNDERCDGFVKLEHDIPNETIADDDIERTALARAGGQIATLEITVKVEPSLPKEQVRLLHDGVSLLRLLPNGEQTNRGIGTAEDAFSVNRAKPGKLEELSCRAVDVCS